MCVCITLHALKNYSKPIRLMSSKVWTCAGFPWSHKTTGQAHSSLYFSAGLYWFYNAMCSSWHAVSGKSEFLSNIVHSVCLIHCAVLPIYMWNLCKRSCLPLKEPQASLTYLKENCTNGLRLKACTITKCICTWDFQFIYLFKCTICKLCHLRFLSH